METTECTPELLETMEDFKAMVVMLSQVQYGPHRLHVPHVWAYWLCQHLRVQHMLPQDLKEYSLALRLQYKDITLHRDLGPTGNHVRAVRNCARYLVLKHPTEYGPKMLEYFVTQISPAAYNELYLSTVVANIEYRRKVQYPARGKNPQEVYEWQEAIAADDRAHMTTLTLQDALLP